MIGLLAMPVIGRVVVKERSTQHGVYIAASTDGAAICFDSSAPNVAIWCAGDESRPRLIEAKA